MAGVGQARLEDVALHMGIVGAFSRPLFHAPLGPYVVETRNVYFDLR